MSGQKWERLTASFEVQFEAENYGKALDFALRSLNHSREKLDSTDRRMAISCYHVAKAYYYMDKPGNARSYIRKAYSLQHASYANAELLAEICRLYGRIELALGYLDSAERMLNRSKDIFGSGNGKERYAYVKSLYYLADLEMARAGWKKVVELLEEALRIHANRFLKNREFALYSNYLGLVYLNNQYSHKAAFHFDNAIQSYRELGMERDMTYANACNNLGLIYYYQSEFETSESFYLSADTAYGSMLKGYSPEYAMLLNNLASLYQTWDRMEDAGRYYRILEEYLEASHVNPDLQYINSLENLASYYTDLEDYQRAESYYRRVIELRKSVNPDDQFSLARSYLALASVCYYRNRFMESAEMAEKSLKIYRVNLPPASEEVLNTLSFLGVLKMQLQDFTGAIGIYMEVLERIDTTTQARHALNAYEGLSEAYQRKNQEEKAALFLQKAIAAAKEIQRSDTILPPGTEGIEPALDDTIMPARVPLR